jgi:selenocysteine lyase/cysteine desulfurase
MRDLEEQGLELQICHCDREGFLDMGMLEKTLREKKTKLVVICHASNVTGTIQDLKRASSICRKHGARLLVDASQSAGVLDIDVPSMGIDLLAFTGHKGLLGPQGVGGLYLAEGIEVRPLMRGGTGSRSDSELQPDFLPDEYESGTLNAIGLHALAASLDFVRQHRLEIEQKERELTQTFLGTVQGVEGVHTYGPADASRRTSVVSFNVDGLASSDVSRMLDLEYGILSRPGLHCAPLAHRTIDTFHSGAVRFSFGFFNTASQIERAGQALERMAAGHGKRR